jgi:hypothetical protein
MHLKKKIILNFRKIIFISIISKISKNFYLKKISSKI